MDISSIDYPAEKSKIINAIESIMIDKSDICSDEHQAFNLLAADLFASSSRLDESLFITDGPSDQGIDFYTSIDNSYEIFQCKFPEIDNLILTDRVISFSQDGVKELMNAFEYLKSNHVQTTVKEDVKLLRAHLRSKDNPNISFNLCIFGELTLDARQKYNKFKEENESDLIEINLFEYKASKVK